MLDIDIVSLNVLDFLSNTLKKPKSKIHLSDSIFHDLGVDGDDAIDLIRDYSERFNVSLDDFKINDYFGSEGSSLIHLVIELVTKRSYKSMPRLEVKDLIEGVRIGTLRNPNK